MNIITINYGSDLRFSASVSGVDLAGYAIDLFDAHPVFDTATVTIDNVATGVFSVVCEWSPAWSAVTGDNKTPDSLSFRIRLRQGTYDVTTQKITVRVT